MRRALPIFKKYYIPTAFLTIVEQQSGMQAISGDSNGFFQIMSMATTLFLWPPQYVKQKHLCKYFDIAFFRETRPKEWITCFSDLKIVILITRACLPLYNGKKLFLIHNLKKYFKNSSGYHYPLFSVFAKMLRANLYTKQSAR